MKKTAPKPYFWKTGANPDETFNLQIFEACLARSRHARFKVLEVCWLERFEGLTGLTDLKV